MHFLKKKGPLILALLLLFTYTSPRWALSSSNPKIQYLMDRGWVEGYEDGSLGLDKGINRAEFSKMMVVISGQEEAAQGLNGEESPFIDLPHDHWAKGYIFLAQKMGYVNGYPGGDFNPQGQLTYAHVVTILSRMDPSFTDSSQKTNPWYGKYSKHASYMGYLNGLEELNYEEPAQRGPTLEIMYNFLKSIGGPSHITKIRGPIPGQTEAFQVTYAKIDPKIFQESMLKRVNALRASQGADPLIPAPYLEKGTDIRAKELASIGNIRINNVAHIRLNGDSFRTAFEYLADFNLNNKYLGENLAVSTLSRVNQSDQDFTTKVVDDLFNQWKKSPSHYENMIDPKAKIFASSASFDPKTKRIIGVQIFGIPVLLEVE